MFFVTPLYYTVELAMSWSREQVLMALFYLAVCGTFIGFIYVGHFIPDAPLAVDGVHVRLARRPTYQDLPEGLQEKQFVNRDNLHMTSGMRGVAPNKRTYPRSF